MSNIGCRALGPNDLYQLIQQHKKKVLEVIHGVKESHKWLHVREYLVFLVLGKDYKILSKETLCIHLSQK